MSWHVLWRTSTIFTIDEDSDKNMHVKNLKDERDESIARFDLQQFYDAMPTHPSFANIDKGDFLEIQECIRNERKAKHVSDTAATLQRFVSLGDLPSKTTSASSGLGGLMNDNWWFSYMFSMTLVWWAWCSAWSALEMILYLHYLWCRCSYLIISLSKKERSIQSWNTLLSCLFVSIN